VKSHDAVRREHHRRIILTRDEQREQPGQVRIVSGDQNVGCLALQAIANPRRGIVGLQIARGAERGKGVTRSPELFGRLTGAQLTAVPHDRRTRPACGGGGRQLDDGLAACPRQRPAQIDLRADRVAVVDEIQVHAGS